MANVTLYTANATPTAIYADVDGKWFVIPGMDAASKREIPRPLVDMDPINMSITPHVTLSCKGPGRI